MAPLLWLLLQLCLSRLFPPRITLQRWTPIDIYILHKEEHSPALYIKTKLQCNEEKPLNDIPIRKSTTCSDVVLFLIESVYNFHVWLTFNDLIGKILIQSNAWIYRKSLQIGVYKISFFKVLKYILHLCIHMYSLSTI